MKLYQNLILFMCLVLSSLSFLHGQNLDVCKEGDCSPDLFDIHLDEILIIPGLFHEDRTTNFIDAYRKFTLIKSKYDVSSTWKVKHESYKLTGVNCLRHYQLEALFGLEYLQNPHFKNFIDSNLNNAKNFEKEAFQNARQGLNLKKRMNLHCPKKVNKINFKKHNKTLSTCYDKLGIKLGYFDENGNVLKSMDESTFIQEISKLSKKKQRSILGEKLVELTDQNNLPSKINTIQADHKYYAFKMEFINHALLQMLSNLKPFISDKMNQMNSIIDNLTILRELGELSFLDKFPELQLKVKNLIGMGEALLFKSEQIKEKAKKIKNSLNQLNHTKLDLEIHLENSAYNIGQYDLKSEDLIKRALHLSGSISEKPFKNIDEIKVEVNSLMEEREYLGEATQLEFKLKNNLLEQIKSMNEQKDLLKTELDIFFEESKQLVTDNQIFEKQSESIKEQIQILEQERMEQKSAQSNLSKKEKELKETYGIDVKLNPVSKEEWSDSFEVKRPFWEATFHPDDEVIQGFKGKYFKINLKDADKEVRLLFGPGEYYKSQIDFRKNYGSTIGIFVAEALHLMKTTDQGKVNIFIQGSADISGNNSFSGNQIDQFTYHKINVLPKIGGENRFSRISEIKSIPTSDFKNKHLPNLRAKYLKQMIRIYSKKIDPIILEGTVKQTQDKEERNAIIYLFIPETILYE